jgi:alkylation response protein AidB-like acyl-CoA dehydrogenase
LIETAEDAARAAYLPDIAAGTLTATVGFGAQGIEWSPDSITATARSTREGFVLNGSFRHVVDGATAELLLLTARWDGDVALFAVPRSAVGVTSGAHTCVDRTRRIASVALNDAPAAGDALIARGERACEGLSRTSALAAIALAAEQLGGAQQCLDLTLQHVSGRVQFGRTINSFQAVKHRCAQMMVMIEATRSALIGAANRVSAGAATTDLALEAACVKTFASEAFYFCAAEAIQLHGGVGFTWDYDPHLYFKRAQMSSHWLGSADTMRERVAAALLDGPETR